jgi:hypothetical protein
MIAEEDSRGAKFTATKKTAGKCRHFVKCDISGSHSGDAENACILEF